MKYIKKLMILSLLIFLGGCAVKISPYNVKVDENKEASDSEKRAISSHALAIVVSNQYKTVGNCIYYDSKWDIYDDKLRNCFVVEDDLLQRIDDSECYRYDKGSKRKSKMECFYIGGGEDDYAKYINKIQDSKKIVTTYNDEIRKYLIFKNNALASIRNNGPKFFEEEVRNAEEKVKNTHINFRSSTIPLPKKIHDELLKKVQSEVFFKKDKSFFDLDKADFLEAYRKGTNIEERRYNDKEYISSYININHFVPKMSYIERYKIGVSSNYIKEQYKNVKTDITFNINQMEYDFIPDTYLNSNVDISIKFEKKTNTITFVNNTNKFINIADISIYYNNDIFTNSINYQLPPVGEKKFSGVITKNIKEYIELLNDKQSTLFGIAIKYEINNSEKTLFEGKNYIVNSF